MGTGKDLIPSLVALGLHLLGVKIINVLSIIAKHLVFGLFSLICNLAEMASGLRLRRDVWRKSITICCCHTKTYRHR